MQHLAIFTGNSLNKVLAGKKKIESRFARDRRLPFGSIETGDEIYLKKSGGQVLGKVLVRRVLFYKSLTSQKIKEIEQRYNDRILADQSYWNEHRRAKFATLLFLEKPETFEKPVDIKKKDRRAWILLGRKVSAQSSKEQPALKLSQYDSWTALSDQVAKIAKREDWTKFYNDSDLVLNVLAALGDLAEEFQGTNNKNGLPRPKRREKLVKDRIGDMLLVLIYLAHKFDLDLYKAAKQRLSLGKRKQPLERLRKM